MRLPLALALILSVSPGSSLALEAGSRLPALSAQRLERPHERIDLTELRGRVVYVDFWASWCVPCRLSMPMLDALYRKHSARGFIVLGVNKDASMPDAERFLRRVSVGFPLAFDGGDDIARAFDVKAMPSGYLVDRRGIVRKVHRGFTAATAAALEREVEELLGEAQ